MHLGVEPGISKPMKSRKSVVRSARSTIKQDSEASVAYLTVDKKGVPKIYPISGGDIDP